MGTYGTVARQRTETTYLPVSSSVVQGEGGLDSMKASETTVPISIHQPCTSTPSRASPNAPPTKYAATPNAGISSAMHVLSVYATGGIMVNALACFLPPRAQPRSQLPSRLLSQIQPSTPLFVRRHKPDNSRTRPDRCKSIIRSPRRSRRSLGFGPRDRESIDAAC